MDKSEKELLDEALAYMCNLPKIYIKELGLNKDIFLGVMGHICDIARDETDDSHTPKYMPLEYDVVKQYCSNGFPIKYVYGHRAQYRRTIDAAILIYYKLLRTGELEFDDAEREKIFGKYFLNEQELGELDIDTVISWFTLDNPGKVEKARQDGYWLKNFEENWRKKHSALSSAQIEKGQIILDNLFCVEEFNELAERGGIIKTVINFLEKLETESHDRHSEEVLVPYKEYHALHKLLSARPWVKAELQEEHAKLVDRFMRIANFEARKKI